jgi:hypothetical protein
MDLSPPFSTTAWQYSLRTHRLDRPHKSRAVSLGLRLTSADNVINSFSSILTNVPNKLGVLVLGKPFQPRLTFVRKAREWSNVFLSRVGSWPSSQILYLVGMVC